MPELPKKDTSQPSQHGVSWNDVFDVPQGTTSQSIFSQVDRSISRSFGLLSEDLKEYQTSDDPDSSMHDVIRFGMGVTGDFTSRAMAILGRRLTLSNVACCLISALSKMHRYDDNRQSYTLPALVAIRTVAIYLRDVIRKGILYSTLGVGLNIVKMLFDALYDMLAGIMYATITSVKKLVVEKVIKWIRNNNLEVLSCFGFVSLVRALVDALARSGTGLLHKLRAYVISAMLRWHKRSKDNDLSLSDMEILRALDAIIFIINSIIEAINIGLMCSQPIDRSTSDKSTAGSGVSSGDDAGVVDGAGVPGTAEETTPPGSGGGSSVPASFRSVTGFSGITSPSAGDLNPPVTYNGKPVIDVTRLFYEPSATEIARFLTHYLGVPQKEATIAAAAGVSGNCAGRLDTNDRARVEAVINKLGLSL